MASASQKRSVFVGNIPYDATEEQLIQICEEVGPVVSFRLVMDKETGKPKGFGFCEYKDEETASSARRNLQGYDINGRQLRVDFLTNDKPSDGNRGQGRWGSGLAPDPQKHGDSSNQQPVGIAAAMTAASVMAGALGGSQIGTRSNQNGQSVPLHDPLTLHLAQMSRNQLFEVLHQLKEMTTLHKDVARNLLLSSPQLAKALLQVLIMLQLVPPQVLQLPNLRQVPTPIRQTGPQSQLSAQTPSGLPPVHQMLQTSVLPIMEESQSAGGAQIPVIPSQLSASHYQQLQQNTHHVQPGVSGLPNILSQPIPCSSVRPQNQFPAPSSAIQQMQPPLGQSSRQMGSSQLQPGLQSVNPNLNIQTPGSTRPPVGDPRQQLGSSTSLGISQTKGKEIDRSSQMNSSATLAQRTPNANSLSQRLKKSNATTGNLETTSRPLKQVKLEDPRTSSIPVPNRPLKQVKLEDGRGASVPVAGRPLKQVKQEEGIDAPASGSGRPSVPINPNIRPGGQPIVKQEPQLQLPPGIDPDLLQQVLNLTPEQLSLLPPDQQQQVMQLQKVLSNSVS